MREKKDVMFVALNNGYIFREYGPTTKSDAIATAISHKKLFTQHEAMVVPYEEGKDIEDLASQIPIYVAPDNPFWGKSTSNYYPRHLVDRETGKALCASHQRMLDAAELRRKHIQDYKDKHY